jgi:hypothetical protein
MHRLSRQRAGADDPHRHPQHHHFAEHFGDGVLAASYRVDRVGDVADQRLDDQHRVDALHRSA